MRCIKKSLMLEINPPGMPAADFKFVALISFSLS